MMSYFALIVTFAQKYDERYGIGTIISTMLPYTIFLTIFWTLLMVLWVYLGIPLGPDGPIFIFSKRVRIMMTLSSSPFREKYELTPFRGKGLIPENARVRTVAEG
jgi:hypothetical protein